MGNMFHKFKNIILGTTDFDEDEMNEDSIDDNEEEYSRYKERDRERERDRDITDINSVRSRRNSSGSKILSFNTNVQLQVVLTYPKNLQDAAYLCDFIRDNKACVVNLEGVEDKDSQRIADFLSGATYALGGEIQRISKVIFIMAPVNVQITGELKEELKGVFPWVAGASAYK